MISKEVVAVLCTIFGIVSSDIVNAETDRPPLNVTAAPMQVSGQPALEFTVTNVTKEVVPIYESSLPWGYRYAVLLLVVPDGKDPLPGSYPVIDAFPTEPIRLLPGESLKGQVVLSEHLSDVAKQAIHDAILVFWYYAPIGPKGASLGEYGGWTTFRSDSAPSATSDK